MIFNLPILALVVVLLWVPRPWLRRGAVFFRRRRRVLEPWNVREPGDPRLNFRTEFSKSRNYLELFRAGVGSTALMGGAGLPAALATETDALRSQVLTVLGIQAGIILVGLLIQTLRWEKRRITFFPPIFYLAGLSLGWLDWRSGCFAFALIWAINSALPNARSFLMVYAFLLVVFGHLFSGKGLLVVGFGGLLAFLPVLLSLLSRRALTLLTRKPTRSGVPR